MDNAQEKLSERKKLILMGAVEEYITSNSPITSGSVHNSILSTTSPATLRNELNALEAMGYLKQLYTSGGRTPTSKAYRFYVSNLMGEVNFEVKNLNQVKNILEKKTTSLNDIITKLSQTISEATNYPAVVMFNGVNKLTLENIRIIPLLTGKALVLLQTNAGIINDNIDVSEPITEQNCIDASTFLTNAFKHKTIEEMINNIDEIENAMLNEIKDFKNLICCFIDSIQLVADKRKVKISSTIKLLSMPEYSDITKAKEILEIFEDQETVERILDSDTATEDITYKIGKENDNKVLSECSVVKASYKVDGKNIASIGIFGPERMDYAKIASALKYVIDEIKNVNKVDYKGDNDKSE